MSARAVATNSVNLGQGFPDVDGPPGIAKAAADAVLAGKGNQYPPATGIPELQERRRPPPAAVLRPALRPGHRGADHRRRHRGHRRRPARPPRTWRRGDRVRAVLRLLRRQHRDGRRDARAAHPQGPRVPPRPGQAGVTDHRARPGCSCSTARTTPPAWCSPARRPRRSRGSPSTTTSS